MFRRILIALSLSTLVACGPGDEGPGPSPYPRDDALRLNHVQAKGTHNSYHLEPVDSVSDTHLYSHASLDVQLSDQGVRQFELDLHYREGEGFEVFHLPIADDRTTCRRFVDCLALVEAWSDAHPWHVPILIWLEPKDDVDFLDETLIGFLDRYDELEEEILSVFRRSRILTPDELRGDHDDLPSAVVSQGWPTLGALRGRVIFSLLDSGEHRDTYTAAAPNLAGRLLFVASSSPTDPFAAMFKINDARQEAERVRELVTEGFIVTSNVDGASEDATDNVDKLAASLAAGMHYGSSDYPAPVEGYAYWFDLSDGAPARCNPVFPAAACVAEDIEKL